MRTIVLALAAVCAGSVSLAQDLRLFSVASGNVTGGYYAAARAICGVVNRESGGEIRCSPEPTSGSLYNLDAIAEKQAEFASDWHRFAYEGVDVFADVGGLPDIRSVMSLYPEALTILTRADSGIEGSADLLGRSVDIGHPSSGRHATIVRLLGALRLGEANFTELTEFTDNAAINELCDGRLDAVVLIVGHPNSAVASALRDCDAAIRPFFGPDITSVLGESSDYERTVIPQSSYPELEEDVRTYAVMATVVTLENTDPVLVEALVGTVLRNLPELTSEAPILSGLEPSKMASEGLTAPLHPAAREAFETWGAEPPPGQ